MTLSKALFWHRLGSGTRAVLLFFATGTTSRMRRGSLWLAQPDPRAASTQKLASMPRRARSNARANRPKDAFVSTFVHLAITVSSGRCAPGKRDVTQAFAAVRGCHAARADQSVTGCQWHASPMVGGVSEAVAYAATKPIARPWPSPAGRRVGGVKVGATVERERSKG